MFTGDKEGVVKVWDSKSRPRKTRYDFDKSTSVWLSPDGWHLHAVTEDRNSWVARDRDLKTGEIVRTAEDTSASGAAFAVSPDGSWQATALRDGTIRIRSVTDGTQTTSKSPGTVQFFLFQCDGKAMWVRTTDSKLTLFSVPELKWIRSLSVPRAAFTVSPELLVMVDPANPKTIRLFSATDGQELSPLEAHDGDVKTLDMTPDGRWLVSGGDDGFVCLWSLAERRLHWRQRTQLDGTAGVAVSPDAQTIAAYSQAGKSVSLWHVPTKRRTGVLLSATGDLHSIDFSGNGRVLIGLGPSDSGRLAVQLWSGNTDQR
jgi:hypothetical protein